MSVHKSKPEYGFILAAGFGKRLRPYTDVVPKPMVPLGGRPMIDQVIDRLAEDGVKSITVNMHYLADVLQDHLSKRRTPQLVLSHEPVILDTGGGIKHALHTVGDDAFYVVSGDSLWTDGPDKTALERLSAAWDPDKMDVFILLHDVRKMDLTGGVGDYDVDAQGRATRSIAQTGAYMWTSVRLCHPRVFDNTPDEAFSFLQILDKAEADGRLYALVHDGEWYHVSTPEDLRLINEQLAGAGVKARA